MHTGAARRLARDHRRAQSAPRRSTRGSEAGRTGTYNQDVKLFHVKSFMNTVLWLDLTERRRPRKRFRLGQQFLRNVRRRPCKRERGTAPKPGKEVVRRPRWRRKQRPEVADAGTDGRDAMAAKLLMRRRQQARKHGDVGIVQEAAVEKTAAVGYLLGRTRDLASAGKHVVPAGRQARAFQKRDKA